MRFVLTGALVLGVLGVASVQGAEVRDLIAKLNSKDSDQRREAARELGELGSGAKAAVPALTKALRDRDRFVRRYAAEALGNIGADAKDSIPKLVLAMNDEKEVSLAAVAALGKMGKPAIDALTRAVKDTTKEPAVRAKAAQGLGKLGAEARGSVKTLTDVLTGKGPKVKGKKKGKMANDDDIRVDVAVALGDIASAEDTEAVAALRSIAEGKQRNRQLKKAAGDSLRKITGMGPKKKKKK
jgi:HEAT repeat protein